MQTDCFYSFYLIIGGAKKKLESDNKCNICMKQKCSQCCLLLNCSTQLSASVCRCSCECVCVCACASRRARQCRDGRKMHFVEVMVTDLKNKNNKTGRNGKIKTTFFLPHESRFIATGSFWGEGQKLALLQWPLYWVSTFWLLEVVVRGPLGITRISALITCRV